MIRIVAEIVTYTPLFYLIYDIYHVGVRLEENEFSKMIRHLSGDLYFQLLKADVLYLVPTIILF